MASHDHAKTQGCACRGLHIACDPNKCEQQHHAPSTEYRLPLTELHDKAQEGCETCKTLLAGLYHLRVRSEWEATYRQHLEDEDFPPDLHAQPMEDAIQLIVRPPASSLSRVVIRTFLGPVVQKWRHFNFNLTSSQFGACQPFSARRVFPTASTESEQSFDHLRTWIEDCDRHHQCMPKSIPLLPKRVLLVSNDRVRLYQSRVDEKAYYTTLSRRWGPDETWILTRATLDTFTCDLPWPEIPKTVKDAIQITRKLGIDYLWMDSMCIIQFDAQDWLEQSREMSNVYGSSWLNIAAMDSPDAHGGCFRDTAEMCEQYPLHSIPEYPHITIRQQPVHTHQDFGSNYPTSPKSPPLLQRGWVFQERLLPPRVVYYAKDELIWECRELSDCQCGATTVLKPYKPYFHKAFAGGDPLPFVWMQVVGRYSCLNLTYEKDRLVAMAGVARMVLDSGLGGRYLAGLWENGLPYLLPWYLLDTFRKVPSYVAPSWSWLSVSGRAEWKHAEYAQTQPSQIDGKILDVQIQSLTPDGLDSITAGHIVLVGRVLDLNAQISEFQEGLRTTYTLANFPDGDVVLEEFLPDYRMTLQEANAINKVRILFWGLMWGYSLVFFVLRRVEGSDSSDNTTFERLGLYLIDHDAPHAQKIIDSCVRREKVRVI